MVFAGTPIALPNSQRFTVFVKFLYFTEFSKSLFTNQDVFFLLLLVAPHSIVFCDT